MGLVTEECLQSTYLLGAEEGLIPASLSMLALSLFSSFYS